jgi:hypothetical protein
VRENLNLQRNKRNPNGKSLCYLKEREREFDCKWDAAIWRRRQDTGGIYEEVNDFFNILILCGVNCLFSLLFFGADSNPCQLDNVTIIIINKLIKTN